MMTWSVGWARCTELNAVGNIGAINKYDSKVCNILKMKWSIIQDSFGLKACRFNHAFDNGMVIPLSGMTIIE